MSEILGTCSFMNLTGDITIAWTAENRDKVLAMIQKKMDEGYTFFTTKRFLFKKFSKRVKVTEKNIGDLDSIVITDEQFDSMVEDMDDLDIAALVRADNADLVKRDGKSELESVGRAKRPEDVIAKDSIAVRPIRGG